MAEIAKEVGTIGGIATVSVLHSFIPTHWLPFSVVGRAQNWSISRILLVTAFGAILHVLSISLLGIMAIYMANTIAGEEAVHLLASVVLVVMGATYIMMHFRGKGGHHHHNHSMEKMAVVGLVLLPVLSPCATTLPVFLAVANGSTATLILVIGVLLVSTMSVMLTLVTLSYYGAAQLNFRWIEKNDKLLVGCVLCTVGILTYFFHDHDHEHAHGVVGALDNLHVHSGASAHVHHL